MTVSDTQRQLRCRLTRRDGSEWQVLRLELDGGPPRVTARLAGAIRPSRSSSEDPDRLEEEPLERGDRLMWYDADGKVVWSMKAPLGS